MRLRTPLFFIFAGSALVFACSSDPQVRQGDETNPVATSRCIDICSAGFTACTNRNPGDFSGCSDERRQCEKECRAQKAELSADPGDGEVIPPEEIMNPQGEENEEQAPEVDETPADAPLSDGAE